MSVHGRTCAGFFDRDVKVQAKRFSLSPLDFKEEAMARLEFFPDVCAAIKQALAHNGILSPGRYGIG
jgi:hypothetical protein